jgi:hypothetical protein
VKHEGCFWDPFCLKAGTRGMFFGSQTTVLCRPTKLIYNKETHGMSIS